MMTYPGHGSSFTGKIEIVLRASPQLDFEPGSFGHLLKFVNAVFDFHERDELVLKVMAKMLLSDFMPSEGYHPAVVKLCVDPRSEEKVIFSLVSLPTMKYRGLTIDDTDDLE